MTDGPDRMRHRLDAEPVIERISWVLTGAIIALAVLALLTTTSRDGPADTAEVDADNDTTTDPATTTARN